MSLLSWLFPSSEPPKEPGRLYLKGPGSFPQPVVGEASYQAALERICGGRTDESVDELVEARLIHEDANPYDPQAIRVDIGGAAVGYLPREDAPRYRMMLARMGRAGQDAYCDANIRGGWDRGERGRGQYGVWLDLSIT